MKTRSKALLLTLCAIALVVATVFGTMAYLTSTDEVKNTFTVGKVAITLDEAKVDQDGVAVTPAERVKANSYKLMPGHTYIKDPTVHVDADSEDSWIFVRVENGISDFEAQSGGDYERIAEQMETLGWKELDGSAGYGVYYKEYTAGSTDTDLVVFNNFKIAGNANEESGWGNITDAKIIVTAYAVQKDGFDNADDAWTAAAFN